jgi:TRAP-type C4-dicarboxylate transport system substrate-binding protein
MKTFRLGLIFAGLLMTGAAAQDQEPVTITLSEHFPVTHLGSTSGAQHFMERVEELAPGRVEFQHFPGEQLAKAAGQLDAVANGVADMAVVGLVYVTEKVPLSTAVELPGLFSDATVGARAFHRLANNELMALEYEPLNIRPVFVFVVTPYQLMTTKPDPIEDIGGINGLKLRVAGGTGELVADALDAVGVKISPTDLYLSLERGVVDGAISNIASQFTYNTEQLLESFTTNASLGNVAFGLFVNENKWETLPEDVKEVLLQAGEETGSNVARSYMEGDEEAVQKLREMGKTVYELSPQVQEQIAERLIEVEQHWLDQMKQRSLPGQEVLDAFKGYVAETGPNEGGAQADGKSTQ